MSDTDELAAPRAHVQRAVGDDPSVLLWQVDAVERHPSWDDDYKVPTFHLAVPNSADPVAFADDHLRGLSGSDDGHLTIGITVQPSRWAAILATARTTADELHDALGESLAQQLTCSEADSMVRLLQVIGKGDVAADLEDSHAYHDEPGDQHYPGRCTCGEPAVGWDRLSAGAGTNTTTECTYWPDKLHRRPCDLCGEGMTYRSSSDANMAAEMYNPDQPDEPSKLVHPQCGLDAGMMVA